MDKNFQDKYPEIPLGKAKDLRGWNDAKGLARTQERDNIKNQWCKENNNPYSLYSFKKAMY